MPFVRFILTERHPDSGFEDGLFRAAYARRDDSAVSEEDRRTLNECLEWFEKRVKVPDRSNRSISKGYYRRATWGIAWFRDSAAVTGRLIRRCNRRAAPTGCCLSLGSCRAARG